MLPNNQTISTFLISADGKAVILSVLLIVTFIFGALPILILFLKKRPKSSNTKKDEEVESLVDPATTASQVNVQGWEKWIGFANCFSGGVFMAAILLDLLPDSREAMDDVRRYIEERYGNKMDYPLAELGVSVGLFFVWFLETIVLKCKDRSAKNKNKKDDVIQEDLEGIRQEETITETNHARQKVSKKQPDVSKLNRSPLSNNAKEYSNGEKESKSLDSSHINERNNSDMDMHSDTIAGSHNEEGSLDNGKSSHTDAHHIHLGAEGEENSSKSTPSNETKEDNLKLHEHVNDEMPHEHHSGYQHQQHDHDLGSILFEDRSSLRSFLLLIALTFHSVFEGLAIGLQEQPGNLVRLLIAVVAHKIIMAFSVGLSLAQSSGTTTKKFIISIVSILVFSSSSPLGIGIGILVSNLSQNAFSDIITGILQCIATGTFLYITFFEVLPHEFKSATKSRMKKLACVFGGYLVMCILILMD